MFTLLVIYFNPPRQNKPKQIAGTAFHPKKRIPPHITQGILSANLLSIPPVLSRYHSRPRGLFQIPTGLSKFPQAFQTDAGLSKPSQAIPDPRRFFRFPQTFPGPRRPFPASHRLFHPRRLPQYCLNPLILSSALSSTSILLLSCSTTTHESPSALYPRPTTHTDGAFRC